MVGPMLGRMGGVSETRTGWTFLTSHARVLAAIAEDREIRIRDIAARCRLTERAVQKIISDLERDGYLTHVRRGRVNVYRIEPGTILRHPAEAGLTVEDLLSALAQHDARRDGRRDGGSGGQHGGRSDRQRDGASEQSSVTPSGGRGAASES
ncbi:hypothetical protein OK074_5856 [Actinobacteria bacterium OK074]|nr:hypothetical protein OK074_5856 [Actinobacteria bacterium OK074]